MNILSSWLREWVNPKVNDNLLAEKLTMAGLEVDSVSSIAPAFEGVLVGKVLECTKHPDADKLSLCQVDIGEDTPVQIICGALNVRQDLRVIVATVGARLPNGLKIKKAKLRGVLSFGMICSLSELGMLSEANGIEELPLDAPIGQDIRQYLSLDDNII
jgi:phenylalanyl-tRNA synthetase beta chain